MGLALGDGRDLSLAGLAGRAGTAGRAGNGQGRETKRPEKIFSNLRVFWARQHRRRFGRVTVPSAVPWAPVGGPVRPRAALFPACV